MKFNIDDFVGLFLIVVILFGCGIILIDMVQHGNEAVNGIVRLMLGF